jgi:uracil permease
LKITDMKTPSYIYQIDERLPVRLGAAYGLQWAFIAFPSAVIAARLCGDALNFNVQQGLRFLQFTVFTTGLFTFLQTLWGHRYPLLEGPSTALILTFILLAPFGLPAIQGGMAVGGTLLILTVLSGQLKRLIRLFTPNVIGVILMLIALGLLPALLRLLTGVDAARPHGEPIIMLISLVLVLLMATLSYRLKGFWKTISILMGMAGGSLLFYLLGRLDFQHLSGAPWFSLPARWTAPVPTVYWTPAVAFGCTYLAVIVNSLGSLQGIAAITDKKRLPDATKRGILMNGAAGIVCGFLGVVGTVSYGMSPGVILMNRVASRYALTYCGAVLLTAAFLPKLAALLSLVPSAVVGATLCVAMGGQVGAGISIISSKPLTPRDYFVVGLPVLLGTASGFYPPGLFSTLPGLSRVFLGNSLIAGIAAVLVLEHVLCREKALSEKT